MRSALATATCATLALLWVTTRGCDGGEMEARRALGASGYSHVSIGGYAWWGCSQGDDGYRRRFTAKNPVGNRVEGYVCCGWMKGCTIRF